MAVFGVHIATNLFHYTVLDGTKTTPILIAKDRLTTPVADNVPALMDWYETQFDLVLDRYTPERIAYRLTLNLQKKRQLFCASFPLGVLNLLAHKRNLPIEEYVATSYVVSRLGLSKGSDLYAHCNTQFGILSPPWDNNQKHSVLAAWFALP